MYRSKGNDKIFENNKAFQKLIKEEKNLQEAANDINESLQNLCKEIHNFKKQYALDKYKEKLPTVGTTVIARRPELKKGFKVFIKRIDIFQGYETLTPFVAVDIIKTDGQSGKDANLSLDEFVFEPIEN